MKKRMDKKRQQERDTEMEVALYQLGFEESYKIDEKEVMIHRLKDHFYDLDFDDVYVQQLISVFKKGFQEGNEHIKELFMKKYLHS